MSTVAKKVIMGSGAVAEPYVINQSLMFNEGTDDSMGRTFSSGGSRTTWTYSTWFKRVNGGSIGNQLLGYTDGGGPWKQSTINVNQAGAIQIADDKGGTSTNVATTRLLRDPASWLHIVVALDTTQGTAANRVKIYVNGVQETSFSTASYPGQNAQPYFNAAVLHTIALGNTYNCSQYLAETHFIDGIVKTPSDFGETNSVTGQWIAKEYDGSYGTTGFYLRMASGAIGADSSTNSNTFSTTNLSNANVLTDSPTNNFATWNPLVPSTNTFTEGNLKATMSGSAGAKIVSTIGATTGKYYMELLWQNQSNWPVGLTSTNKRQAALSGVSDGSTSIGFWIGSSNTVLYINTSVTSWSGSGTGWSNNDMVGLAVDGVNQTISIYKNGSSIGSYDYSGLGWNQTFFAAGNYVNNNTYLANFGQNPTHSGAISAGSATDGNGIGLFKNAPPSGFLALCTANLPEPAIPLPSENFNTVVWTGNSTDNRVIPVGFAADLTWFKQRTGANWHGLLDTVRGNSNPNVIHSNATNVEGDWTYIFKGHTSTGFTVGTDAAVNANSNTYVAWNWKANGSGSTNNDGNQASSVSANQAAGFSIATFTGTGSYATYGHGLGVIPEVTLTKSRSASGDWYWVTTAIDGSVDYLVLNTTAAAANGSATASTSSVFYSNYPNNQTVVAYNFASKPGYSSIGIFTGNGSNTGPFVNCGFRPAWLLIKLTSASGDHDWFIVDNKRDPDNFLDRLLSPNLNAAEGQADPPLADFLSNGFKIRASSASINGDGATILYMAFAESPFKYANAR